MITFRKRFNPAPVVERIMRTSSVSDGRITFRGNDYHELMCTLQGMVDFPHDCQHDQKRQLINAALKDAISRQEFERAAFETALNAALRKSKERRMEKYFVLTSLSIASGHLVTPIDTGAARLTFPSVYRAKFADRDGQAQKYIDNKRPETPKAYQKVVAEVLARSANEAMHIALEEIDVYRGLLCFFKNFSMELTFGMPAERPINRVVLGGMHTVHRESGKLATDGHWFETCNSFRDALALKESDVPLLKKNVRAVLRRLRDKHQLTVQLRTALVLYIRALDDVDMSSALIKLWAALEHLGANGERNCDALPRRVSFLFKDSGYHEQSLEVIRTERNMLVHRGERSEDRRTQCFLTQSYFRELFRFLLFGPQDFRSLKDAMLFLDMPRDIGELKRRHAVTRAALKFRTPRATTRGRSQS